MMYVRSLLVCLFVGIVFLSPVNADVIDPDYHPVERCVTVGNLDQFPDIAVAGVYVPVSELKEIRYMVDAATCLTKGYKFNELYLFWIVKEYLDSVGLDNIPFPMPEKDFAKKSVAKIIASPYFDLLSSTINPYGGTIPNDSPLVKEELVYNIVRYGEDLQIALAVEKLTFNDGTVKVNQLIASTGVQAGAPVALNVRDAIGDAVMKPGYLMVTSLCRGEVDGCLFNCNGRVVSSFTRQFREGATYIVPGNRFSSGVYWLRLQSGATVQNIKLYQFR